MAPYLDLAGFRALTLVPSAVVTAVETASPGWIDAQLAAESSWIDARLTKRYEAPFASPYPVIVTLWLSRIVSASVYDKHGINADDQQSTRYYEGATTARAEIKEAADAKEGLFELPLRADASGSGVSKGAPRGYSEAGPYVWTDRQAAAARREDLDGTGTHRG